MIKLVVGVVVWLMTLMLGYLLGERGDKNND